MQSAAAPSRESTAPGRKQSQCVSRPARGGGGAGEGSEGPASGVRTESRPQGRSESRQAERSRREDPLDPAVFENPAGFRVEEPWGQEVAVRLPADRTPGAEKNATIFAAACAGGNRGVCGGSWGRDCRRPPGPAISATRTRRYRGVCRRRGLRDADRPSPGCRCVRKKPGISTARTLAAPYAV